jgi:ADP-ribose pyrophosphatase YjhB (NUDIX family)
MTHCPYCGTNYGAAQPWPRGCLSCTKICYLNPTPVAVCLLPVDGGLLCVRRAIQPGDGELALPGGYIDLDESWQTAAARELFEETQIIVSPDEIQHFRTYSSGLGDGILLIFGLARERPWSSLPRFVPTFETSETVVIRDPQKLAFYLHTQAVEEFFTESNTGRPHDA